MNSARRNANLLLLLAAAIWGFSFVAQRVGMRHIEPMTFNGLRFALGALVLLPLMSRGLPGRPARAKSSPGERILILKGGLIAGAVLFCGATFQQYGVVYTTAGKAGFITGLYVVFVPLLGLFLGFRVSRYIWSGAGVAMAGLYLLSAKGLWSIALGDGLVLVGAVFWALHTLVIGKLSPRVAPVPLAVTQFAVVALLSLVGAVVFETIDPAGLRAATVPILYAGALSVGVAFTLQVVAQRHAKPAHAALILSLEAVFAALGGWLLLHEGLGVRGLLGCGLMLTGIILAQAEPKPKGT